MRRSVKQRGVMLRPDASTTCFSPLLIGRRNVINPEAGGRPLCASLSYIMPGYLSPRLPRTSLV